MKLALFAYSRRGRDTALEARDALCGLEDECRCFAPARYAGGDFEAIQPPCAQSTGPLFAWADALVFVGAAGIAVRSIAPWVRDKRTEALRQQVKEIAQGIGPVLTIHDFRITAGPIHTNLLFDVVVPYGFPLSDGQVRSALTEGIKKLSDRYFPVIQVDHSYVAEQKSP